MKKHLLLLLCFIASLVVHAQKPMPVKSIQSAIEEAKKGNKVLLGLFDDESKEFPKDFFKIPKDKLVGLVLDNCHYTSIPTKLSKYKNIAYFRYSWFLFSDAPIANVPPVIYKLKNLEHLIFESKIEGDISTKIKHLKKLKEVSFYRSKLKQFPKAVLALKNLKVLKLECNSFETIPEEISKLKSLEKLSFSGGGCGATPISKIPHTIGDLPNLTSISFGYTKKGIGYLPSSFFNLRKLKNFSCFGCGLKGFPKEIGNLSNLEIIQMMNLDTFDRLPENFFMLPKLGYLLFSVTGENVPDSLIEQKELLDTSYESKLGRNYDVTIRKW